MKRAIIWMGLVLIAGVAGLWAFLYVRSDQRKLVLADAIYAELDHPKWSARLGREKGLLPNIGSGDYNMLYLVDVRRVGIPLSNAISFYMREGDRLGLKEFHVDAYTEAARKFHREWRSIGLQVPRGDDALVLTQLFPASDGNVRRHAPIAGQSQLEK